MMTYMLEGIVCDMMRFKLKATIHYKMEALPAPHQSWKLKNPVVLERTCRKTKETTTL